MAYYVLPHCNVSGLLALLLLNKKKNLKNLCAAIYTYLDVCAYVYQKIYERYVYILSAYTAPNTLTSAACTHTKIPTTNSTMKMIDMKTKNYNTTQRDYAARTS